MQAHPRTTGYCGSNEATTEEADEETGDNPPPHPHTRGKKEPEGQVQQGVEPVGVIRCRLVEETVQNTCKPSPSQSTCRFEYAETEPKEKGTRRSLPCLHHVVLLYFPTQCPKGERKRGRLLESEWTKLRHRARGLPSSTPLEHAQSP